MGISVIEEQHRAHKERLTRLGGNPSKPITQTYKLEQTIAELRRHNALLQEDNDRLREKLGYQQRLVGKLSKENQGEAPKFHEIVRAVCEYYGVTDVDIKGQRRTKEIIKPRHVLYYLARKITGMSFPQIGVRIGNRDHTTTLHGSRSIESQISWDEKLRAEIETLEGLIAEIVAGRRKFAREVTA